MSENKIIEKNMLIYFSRLLSRVKPAAVNRNTNEAFFFSWKQISGFAILHKPRDSKKDCCSYSISGCLSSSYNPVVWYHQCVNVCVKGNDIFEWRNWGSWKGLHKSDVISLLWSDQINKGCNQCFIVVCNSVNSMKTFHKRLKANTFMCMT